MVEGLGTGAEDTYVHYHSLYGWGCSVLSMNVEMVT